MTVKWMADRLKVGTWTHSQVAEAFAVEVNHATKCRGFRSRSEFVRYAVESP